MITANKGQMRPVNIQTYYDHAYNFIPKYVKFPQVTCNKMGFRGEKLPLLFHLERFWNKKNKPLDSRQSAESN